MMSSRRKNTNENAGDAFSADIAGQEAKRASARSDKALSRMNLVLRVLLFVAACAFSTIGVITLLNAVNTQSVSRSVTVASMRGEPVGHALVLMSYDESDANVAYERDGVLDVLNRASVSSDIVYMDARSTAGNATAEQRVTAQIKGKAALAGGYDAIVAAGDDALAYVEDHQDLFSGVPLAFFAVDDQVLANRVQAAGIGTGYVEDTSVASVVEQACALMPAANRMVVLVDGSREAKGMLAQLDKDASAANSKAQVERGVWDVSTMTRDKLGSRLGELGNDSFVLLLAANRDSAGAVFTPSETAHFLGSATTVPVFSVTGGVGEGICGAAFIDSASEGLQAATLAVDLVNGKKASELPVQSVAPVNSVFDAAALSSHGIDANAVPDNSTVINEPAFSWRALQPFVVPALFLLAAILCIVGFGVIGFRRSVRSNRAIVESRDELQYRLFHDLLTDLPNRYALDSLAQSPEKSAQIKSMVQIDISDFTNINDSYGHAFGDEVIKAVAQRLKKAGPSFLARSGGDEFTLAFDEPLSAKSSVLNRVEQVFAEPVSVGDNKVELTTSIGIANREKGMTCEDLITNSDLAINYAKDENLKQPVFYTEQMRDDVERTIAITEYLKRAIANEDVTVLWQPQVDTNNLTVVGYEALCRLGGNEYYPNDFIPVAEMSGLVNPLDRIMTKKVIEQLGAWLKDGRDVGVASINFSAAQLRDKGYCDFLSSQLAKNGVPASLVKIEITESMIIGNEEDAERLFAKLASMGITLALDDFGTGYSSLYRMASRPVDSVKLDKTLVDTFMVPGKETFIDDVTRLIHGLGKTIVVEGVETYEQYQICHTLGCDVIQGYFFAKPLTAEEVIGFDANKALAGARAAVGDKTRNADWQKYDRDSRGRWTKNSKKK